MNQSKLSLGDIKNAFRESIHTFVVINCFQVYDSVVKLFVLLLLSISDMTRTA